MSIENGQAIEKKADKKKTDTEITDKIDTEQKKTDKVVPGLCHGCNEDVAKDCIEGATEAQKEHARELVCICCSCISKGKTHNGLGLKVCV